MDNPGYQELRRLLLKTASLGDREAGSAPRPPSRSSRACSASHPIGLPVRWARLPSRTMPVSPVAYFDRQSRHDQKKTDCPRPGMSTVGVECVDWQQLEPDPVLLGDLSDLVN